MMVDTRPTARVTLMSFNKKNFNEPIKSFINNDS